MPNTCFRIIRVEHCKVYVIPRKLLRREIHPLRHAVPTLGNQFPTFRKHCVQNVRDRLPSVSVILQKNGIVKTNCRNKFRTHNVPSYGVISALAWLPYRPVCVLILNAYDVGYTAVYAAGK
jgi:hypothetical protein